jgi:hypothetical protein
MATPEELERAHAYAYGGCIMQDLGYYPFSSKFFSDLTHYVRSGDFVAALIRESQDINEYAFALGALAHYAADNSGHRMATNLAVPMLYPELGRRFGKTVTYWDSPLSHIRTEFGFDVLQVAQGRYAPDQYRKFIGFQMAKPLLERAFLDTYGIELKDVFRTEDLAFESFRYSVGSIIPGMTRVAWKLKKETLIKEIPGVTQKKFLYNLSRSSYEKEWGTGYRRPGIRTRLVTWVVSLVPKSGPFKSLAFRTPTPEVEKLFMASFNATIDSYRILLANVDAGGLAIPNENFDMGRPTPITTSRQPLRGSVTTSSATTKIGSLRRLRPQRRPAPNGQSSPPSGNSSNKSSWKRQPRGEVTRSGTDRAAPNRTPAMCGYGNVWLRQCLATKMHTSEL